MSSCPVLHIYQTPSKYSEAEGFSINRADIKSIKKKQKTTTKTKKKKKKKKKKKTKKTNGDNSKSNKTRVVIIVRDNSSRPVLHLNQVS